MIVQLVLDFFSTWVSGVISLVTQFTDELWGDQFAEVVGYWDSGITTIATFVAPLGILVPFDAIFTVIQWFLALLAWWLLIFPLRGVLWLAGR